VTGGNAPSQIARALYADLAGMGAAYEIRDFVWHVFDLGIHHDASQMDKVAKNIRVSENSQPGVTTLYFIVDDVRDRLIVWFLRVGGYRASGRGDPSQAPLGRHAHGLDSCGPGRAWRDERRPPYPRRLGHCARHAGLRRHGGRPAAGHADGQLSQRLARRAVKLSLRPLVLRSLDLSRGRSFTR